MMLITDQPRQVLLFYNANGSETWEKQSQELKNHEAGLRERDIEVTSFRFSKENAEQWKKWDVDTSSNFTYVLVGRDGGVKHKSGKIVSCKELFALVDAMPMRKYEVKKE